MGNGGEGRAVLPSEQCVLCCAPHAAELRYPLLNAPLRTRQGTGTQGGGCHAWWGQQPGWVCAAPTTGLPPGALARLSQSPCRQPQRQQVRSYSVKRGVQKESIVSVGSRKVGRRGREGFGVGLVGACLPKAPAGARVPARRPLQQASRAAARRNGQGARSGLDWEGGENTARAQTCGTGSRGALNVCVLHGNVQRACPGRVRGL